MAGIATPIIGGLVENAFGTVAAVQPVTLQTLKGTDGTKPDNTLLYFGIGAGLLLVVMIAVVVMYKSK